MLYLFGQRVILLGMLPDVTPVLTVVLRITRSDYFEHVLRRVRIRWALLAFVTLEVANQLSRVVAKLTMIDKSTAGLQQYQLIKLFEQHGRLESDKQWG